MAEEHNALKYAPTISRAGAIASGGAYGDVGISRLSESLVPIIDLWGLPEWALLRGEILFSRRVLVNAVAGRFSTCEIVNPQSSNRIAVVQLQPVNASTFIDVSIDNGGAVAANPVTNRGQALDGRWPVQGETSTCTIVTGDGAAGTALIQWTWRAALGSTTVSPKWIITPGRKLFMATNQVNETMHLNVFIAERQSFPGELQARG